MSLKNPFCLFCSFCSGSDSSNLKSLILNRKWPAYAKAPAWQAADPPPRSAPARQVVRLSRIWAAVAGGRLISGETLSTPKI